MIVELSFLLAAVGYGTFRLLRSQAAARRYLEEGATLAPLELDHLSLDLRRLVQEARTLRIALDSPIRSIRELLQADLTRTHEDIESIDHLLMETSRQVHDWLGMVDRLSENDRMRLDEVGASPEPIREILRAEHGAFERARFRVAGQATLDHRLAALAQEFARIETALAARSRIYR